MECPKNRWDFKRALQFYHDTKIVSKIPNDEMHYIHKWQVQLKEKNQENSLSSLEKLYEVHQKLYQAYDTNVTRPNEAKFHLDRAWVIVKKMRRITGEKIKEKEQNMKIFEKIMFCLLRFGDWFLKMGNLGLSELYFNKSLTRIQEWQHEKTEQNIAKKKDEDKKIKNLEGDGWCNLGLLYDNMGNLPKAEKIYLNP